ncbi:hypothetical protein [Pokkaliibacter plantistimulans]|uniref:hypothetical protein n=1 Tax=Pokkaliibacter plantistimulans TaxID=1635171 RepID=UPI001057F22E|nr:hypothetical protein [Pokkaliibacter plantistimulans]
MAESPRWAPTVKFCNFSLLLIYTAEFLLYREGFNRQPLLLLPAWRQRWLAALPGQIWIE